MKPVYTTILFLLAGITAYTQSVDYDRGTNLVKVNNIDSFLLVKKNKDLFNFDLSLQNRRGEELAYLKEVQIQHWDPVSKEQKAEQYFIVTFNQTGNYCKLPDNGFNETKWVAKQIVAAGLIVNNTIEPSAERRFIISYKGFFNNDNTAMAPAINYPPPAADYPPPGNNTVSSTGILIKANRIYSNDEMIGSFKNVTSYDNYQTIQVYNKDGFNIAEASHPNGNNEADWQVKLINERRTITLLFNPDQPLEALFRYFLNKGYLH